MPEKRLVRGEQVVAVRPRAHAGGDLLRVKVPVRIDDHFFIEATQREAEVRRPEAARDGPRRRHRGHERPHEHDAVGLEAVEAEPPDGVAASLRVVPRFERGRVGGEDRLAHALLAEPIDHVDQPAVPVRREPVVSVDLQRVGLAGVLLLDQVPRPADAAAFRVRHVDDGDARVRFQTVERIAGRMLPAEADAQSRRVLCLCQAVAQRVDQVELPVGRDADEDGRRHDSLRSPPS